MTTAARGLFRKLWQPHLIIVRNRTKLNITRPRAPHYERALLEHICTPYFTKEKKLRYVPNYDACEPVKIVEEELNPYEVVLSRLALNHFQNSKIIAFYQVNTFDPEDMFQNKVIFKKNGYKFVMYPKKVINASLKGTIYEPCNILFQTFTGIAVGQDTNIKKLFQTLSKLTKFVLLGALIENKLLSVSDLEYYGKFENIDEARSKLVGVLNAASMGLVQNINYHQRDLVQKLTQYQELEKK